MKVIPRSPNSMNLRRCIPQPSRQSPVSGAMPAHRSIVIGRSFRQTTLTRFAAVSFLLACLGGCATIKNTASSVADTVKGWWPGGESDSTKLEKTNVNVLAPGTDSLALSAAPTPSPETQAAPVPGDQPLPGLAPETGAAPTSEVLTYWETIKGGQLLSDTAFGRAAGFVVGNSEIELVRPTALAMRGEMLYIVDSGLELVLRLDRTNGRIKPITELKGITRGEVDDIYVAEDFSFYITDTDGSRVYRMSPEGKIVHVFENKLNLARPVAVAEDKATRDVLVADAEFDHVLIFSNAGELLSAMGGRGNEPGKFLNITTMAPAPDGFYIGARVGEHVQVLSRNGDYLFSLDPLGIRFPFAMAADPDFRLYVGDYLDNTIKVYSRGRYVTSIGGTGVGPGKFKRITDLWFDRGFLYVADSLNGRVQVMKVAEDIGPPIVEPLPVIPPDAPKPVPSVDIGPAEVIKGGVPDSEPPNIGPSSSPPPIDVPSSAPVPPPAFPEIPGTSNDLLPPASSEPATTAEPASTVPDLPPPSGDGLPAPDAPAPGDDPFGAPQR